eukprot:3596638-Rhodomonas_salina.2
MAEAHAVMAEPPHTAMPHACARQSLRVPRKIERERERGTRGKGREREYRKGGQRERGHREKEKWGGVGETMRATREWEERGASH